MIAKQAAFRLTSLLVGFVLAFIIGEVAVRILAPQATSPIQYSFDPLLGPIPVPNQRGRSTLPHVFDYTYANNSMGLRGSSEYSFSKLPDYRILLLGDSFTYGIGVDDNQTFAHHLRTALSSKKQTIEIINAGNQGKGTDYALKFFRTLGHKFKPNLTILFFSSTDFHDNQRGIYYKVDVSGKIKEIPEPLANTLWAQKSVLRYLPTYNWWISWSQLVNLVKTTALQIIIRQGQSLQIPILRSP